MKGPCFGENNGFLTGRDGGLQKTLLFTARNGLVRARARPEPARVLKVKTYCAFLLLVFDFRF